MTGLTSVAASQKSLLQLVNVSKRFGDKVILDNVNFELYDREAVAIVGPSGTGKSTILRLLCGLLAPDSGTVLIGGQPIHEIEATNSEFSVRVGMVFQQAALFDSLTVEENVGFLLHEKTHLSAAKIREIVRYTLSRVGLKDIEDLYPASLSGGMRKRVSFARAIIGDPALHENRIQVLLYDEPTAGLDPIASTVIEDLIRDLHKGGNTHAYIVVTHQESTIRRTADRVVMFYQGQIRWQGKVADIDHEENPYVRQFFSGQVVGPIG